MVDRMISAPHSIGPMATQMRDISGQITTLMEQLAQENNKLRASGTTGASADAFEQAQGLWRRTGLGESDRTTAMAKASNDFKVEMHNMDQSASRWF